MMNNNYYSLISKSRESGQLSANEVNISDLWMFNGLFKSSKLKLIEHQK